MSFIATRICWILLITVQTRKLRRDGECMAGYTRRWASWRQWKKVCRGTCRNKSDTRNQPYLVCVWKIPLCKFALEPFTRNDKLLRIQNSLWLLRVYQHPPNFRALHLAIRRTPPVTNDPPRHTANSILHSEGFRQQSLVCFRHHTDNSILPNGGFCGPSIVRPPRYMDMYRYEPPQMESY